MSENNKTKTVFDYIDRPPLEEEVIKNQREKTRTAIKKAAKLNLDKQVTPNFKEPKIKKERKY